MTHVQELPPVPLWLLVEWEADAEEAPDAVEVMHVAPVEKGCLPTLRSATFCLDVILVKVAFTLVRFTQ